MGEDCVASKAVTTFEDREAGAYTLKVNFNEF
jgi:hypothetical protein